MLQTIQNDFLTVQINEMGAELWSIQDTLGTEYLWEGDKKFWGRRSPILFPIVGSLKEKQYRYHEKTYQMNQHGFARDMKFTLVKQEALECWYQLCSNEDTKEKYPFEFELEIGYRLIEKKIQVIWKVKNLGTEQMYFSIGAHPAFCCPIYKKDTSIGMKERGEERKEYFLKLDGIKKLELSMIDPKNGLLQPQTKPLFLSDDKIDQKSGFLAIEDSLFENDALIVEQGQTQKVSLCTPDKKEYLSVSFDAPLFGIWSPKQNEEGIAPFICIEPWYGRCDRTDFTGELSQREWGNQLEVKSEFKAEYEIEIYN